MKTWLSLSCVILCACPTRPFLSKLSLIKPATPPTPPTPPTPIGPSSVTGPLCVDVAGLTTLTTTAVDNGMQLQWTRDGTVGDKLAIARSIDSGDWQELAEVAPDATSYVDDKIAPDSTYQYRVTIVLANCVSPETVGPIVATPPNAAQLTFGATTTSTVALSWSDPNQLETGYRVERSADGGVTYIVLAMLGTDMLAYSDSGLAPNKAYRYRVVVVGQQTLETAATSDVWTFPNPATGLTVTTVSSVELDLSWTDTNGGALAYDIQRSVAGGPFAAYQQVMGAMFADTGLTPGTTYAYRVSVANPAGSAPAITASDRTAFLPMLVWTAAPPTLGPSCGFALPGTVTLDGAKGASFAQAAATLAPTGWFAVGSSGPSGLTLVSGPLGAGVFSATWTIVDSLGGSAQATRNFTLAATPQVRALGVSGNTNPQRQFEGTQPRGLSAASGFCERGCGGTISSISLGTIHTCALTGSGAVKCWGSNADGQIGTSGSTADRYNPKQVCINGTGNGTSCPGGTALTNATELSVGPDFSCARLADGTARCWGSNANRQLGLGNVANPPSSDWPTASQVCGVGGTINPTTLSCDAALTGIAGVAAGMNRACAVMSSGGVRCWGLLDTINPAVDYPQDLLGYENYQLNPEFVQESSDGGSFNRVSSASLGDTHGCLVNDFGHVFCWGHNCDDPCSSDYVLGVGQTQLDLSRAKVVSCAQAQTVGCHAAGYLQQAVALAAGRQHTCALLSGGRVKCWGSNVSGQIGDGTTTWRDYPVEVCAGPTGTAGSGGNCPNPLQNAVAVGAAQYSSCALLLDGSVKCWGEIASGNAFPQTVSAVTGAVALSVGRRTACAVRQSGQISCWGDFNNGICGRGNGNCPAVGPVCATGVEGTTCVPLADASLYSCTRYGVTEP